MGSVVFSENYFPYGAKRSGSGDYLNLFNLFTDQYFDIESDICYYNQRYYSQKLGRFVSADPQRAINGVSEAVMNVGKVAAAGLLAGSASIAAPILVGAVAPKIAAYSLAATMEYNIAVIGMGKI